MKIIYQDDTKRFSGIQDYEQLKSKVANSFGNLKVTAFPESLKFYYVDEDGDVISVSSQGDFEEAQQVLPDHQLRLIIAENIEQAREILSN